MHAPLRWIVAGLLAASLTPQLNASDRDAAQRIVERAIQSAGGAERLGRMRVLVRSARGTMIFFGKEFPLTTRLTIAFPNRFRDQIQVEAQNQKLQIIRVLAGDKAWQVGPDVPRQLGNEEVHELQEELYVLRLLTLLPLREPDFTIVTNADQTVDGAPAAGIRVSHAGHADTKVYFDKRTDRLVKMERRVREAGVTVDREYLFSAPSEWQGIRVPMRQVERTDGKKTLDLVITSYEFPDRVDEKLFGRP